MSSIHDEPLWTPEPIVGYRGWTWENGTLRGPHSVWPTRKLVAKHVGPEEGSHPSPDPNWKCYCGINVHKQPLPTREYPILGKIHVTGMVHEYTNGYRAQYGEIVEVMVYHRYLSSLRTDELTRREDLIMAGVMDMPEPWWPREKVDIEIANKYQVPVYRGMQIIWREENGRDRPTRTTHNLGAGEEDRATA